MRLRQPENPTPAIRSSALWGKSGRGLLVTLLIGSVLAAPVAATAEQGHGKGKGKPHSSASGGKAGESRAPFVAGALLKAAKAKPNAVFKVVVQGRGRKTSASVASDVQSVVAASRGKAKGVKRKFLTIKGVSAELTGRQILRLARKKDIYAITQDAPVGLAAAYSNDQIWPNVARLASLWSGSVATTSLPTIAIVDSGVDATRPDVAGRLRASLTLTSLAPNAPGDGRGHGTFVASIAAGAAAGHAGAAPTANLVSIDVMDDSGMALTSDVIAAADWILQNKQAYGIRVANFSLHSSVASSFMYDPLDKAVERLWFSGVVVVVAAGNYAQNGQASGVLYAPANDPFVITVGAADHSNSVSTNDDFAAPWSAWGYTPDGFLKPEVGAPGRYMVGAVPPQATMPLERPDRLVAPGYMWMSGTSFAAPVVSGAAAWVLAAHPNWTPDEVKGALMVAARPSSATNYSLGVGEVYASASAKNVTDPPNPNLALNRFVVSDPAGRPTPVFDAAAWASTAQSDAAWASAVWNSAAWNSAAWNSAAWGSAAWSAAAWASASWASASWSAAAWANAAWAQ